MARYDIFEKNCPLRFPLSVIGSKWGSLILLALESKELRFSELCRSIGGISERMASQNLKHLEKYGLVRRHVIGNTAPPQVRYSLTPLGHDFVVPLTRMVNLADANATQMLWPDRQ